MIDFNKILKDGNSFNDFITFIKNHNEKEPTNFSFYQTMLFTLIDQAPIGIYILGEKSFTYVNAHFSSMLGYTKEELTSGDWPLNKIIHPEDFSEIQQNITKRIAGDKKPTRYKIRQRTKDGRLIYTDVHGTAAEIYGEMTMFGTVVDITEQVEAERLLYESNERYESLFQNSPDAIFTLDDNGMFTSANPASEVMTGYTNEEILKMSLEPVVIPEDLPKAFSHFQNAKEGIPNNSDISIKSKDGRIIQVNATHFPMKVNGEIVGTYGIARDITRRKILDKQLEELAFYDPLTKLPNRKLFEDRLNQLIQFYGDGRQQFAVVFLDLDRFKFINDSLGHQIGDEFLIRFAERLTQSLRKTDTISRFAGDEFTILLPDITREEVLKLVEHINDDIMKEPFIVGGHSMTVTASIGIAFNNGSEDTVQELIRNADTAMYYTKKNKRNGYTVYSEKLDLKAAYKLTIEQDLQHAVQNNELELYYQPIVDLKTGKLISLEALIRWNHPEFGIVSPLDFIPIAEESGQIIAIGAWVLREACQQTKKWQDSGKAPVKTSVNISTKQLQHDNFVEVVLKIVEETKLDPKWLELEVTESILLDDVGYIKNSLLKLKKAGISISIDDFGTGYTSLSYLRQYPFDKVKIDRSFIEDINKDLNGKRITSAIISLAHSLNMHVVAEGIEDEIQLNYLKEENCDEGQGYLFSRPMPVQMLTFDEE